MKPRCTGKHNEISEYTSEMTDLISGDSFNLPPKFNAIASNLSFVLVARRPVRSTGLAMVSARENLPVVII